MALEDQQIYQEVEAAASECLKVGANLMVASLSGMGASFILKTWAEKNGVDYIAGIPEKKVGMVVVDNPDLNWEEWEQIYKEAPRDQKLIMVVSASKLKEISKAKDWVLSHVYKTVWVGARSEADAKKLVADLSVELKKDQLSQIFKQSGGIAKLIKWLAINGGQNEGVEEIAGPILKEVRETEESDLEKLGIIKEGVLVSGVLMELAKKQPEGLKIEINFDLSLKEKGENLGAKLTPDEKKIVEAILLGGGKIEREKIAEIKWGEGSFDKFSDQAISVAMRRLAGKFRKHELVTIPRVGYQLKVK